MGNIASLSLNNASSTVQSTTNNLSSVQSMLDLQFTQGVELARIQAQSGMIKALTEALQAVSRNVGP